MNPPTNSGFQQFLCTVVNQIIDPIMLLLAALAGAYFIFGITKFVFAKAQGEEALDGRNSMIWGIVGLVIIFGALAIVNLIAGTDTTLFGGNTSTSAPSCKSSDPSPSTGTPPPGTNPFTGS